MSRIVPVVSFCSFLLALLVGILLSVSSVTAQDTSNSERSAAAIAVLRRVLDASGGISSIAAIRDAVATGTLSTAMSLKETKESSVTISMRGREQLRMDSEEPTGTRSMFYNHGGVSSKDEHGAIASLGSRDAMSSISHFFPLQHYVAALNDPSYSVIELDPSMDEQSGHTLYHLRLQRTETENVESLHRARTSIALDYYIDATSDCIVRVQNRHSDRGMTPTNRDPFEIYQFSDYRAEHGILLPHQITVWLEKRLISTINITGYQLNTGLNESHFTPAQK